ncbi:hypothetical protein AH06_216 [Erwinia phage AH06]|nr:hypothetical protein AH06_216 [Erwinia phage AH06]
MNLYLVRRTDAVDWDQHRSLVVSAESEEQARWIHPAALEGFSVNNFDVDYAEKSKEYFDEDAEHRYNGWRWVKPSQVHTLSVTLIGTTHLTVPTIIVTDDSSA